MIRQVKIFYLPIEVSSDSSIYTRQKNDKKQTAD